MTKEREISLRDLFWYVLSRWKLLIVFMILGALLLGAFTYMRGTEITVNAETGEVIDEDAEPEEEAEEESLVYPTPVTGLTDIDVASLNVYFSYKKMYDMQLEYNNTAEIMQLDPYSTWCGYFNYFIEAEDQDMLQPLTRAYDLALRSLQEKYGEITSYGTGTFTNTANAYGANESLEETEAMVSQVYAWVLGETEEICRERMKEIEAYVEEKAAEFNETVVPCRLYGLQENVRIEYKDTVANRQKTNYDNLNTYTNGMNNAYKNFSDFAKTFLKETSVETYEEDIQEQLDGQAEAQALIDEWYEEHAEDIAAEEEKAKEEVVPEPEIKTETRVVRGISKRMIVLGLLVGLVIGIILLAIRYALSFKVKAEEDMEYITQLPLLAFVRDDNKRKKFFIDAAIEKKRFKNLRYQNESDGLQAAAVKIRKLAEANNASEVYVSGSFMGSRETAVASRLKELLAGSGVSLFTGDASSRCGSSIEEAAKTGYAILAEKEWKSDYESIVNTVRDFGNAGVKVLGMFAVE